ncbi:MAG: protein kinase [Deltaproteobacteria bacterium]|nr:protein kinase [Deltaproteobacteria bacterium]
MSERGPAAIVAVVPGQAAEQIIAGVVLSERLSVTMYGAIHRASFAGQRNLRGLVVDPKMLAETSFRIALTEPKAIRTATGLDHPAIVPTFAVESGGPDVVVVTRGVGRYVTVQDLISAARATRGSGGRLDPPVAAAIGKAVVEALAVAHKANVVHGAVHPRSVLIDDDGAVRLGDFVVGRALTTAVAQGADSSLWRGLAGFLAPELVVGEDPAPAADVFACGALLFTMLSGEAPPGPLHVTPAVERLVQRALDTDVSRRYKNATDLLENLLEAFEDDRWDIADRGEIIKAAGLSRADDSNIDEDTEDLLASLGNNAVQVLPTRPSVDLRAEVAASRSGRVPTTGTGKLDALLADLDDSRELTAVEDFSFKRDPISELIQMDPRRKEAIVQVKPRVPSLDDPDDHTPLPPPSAFRDSDYDLRAINPGRQNTHDEAAALDAIAGLDEPVRRVSTAADQASAAADKLEAAALRAEKAADQVEKRQSAPRAIAKPNLAEMPDFTEQPTPRLKSRALGIISLIIVIGGGIAFWQIYKGQQEQNAEQRKKQEEAQRIADEQTRLASKAQMDRGTISVTADPPDASVWLKLGRTNLDTMVLASGQMHRIRLELPGYQSVDTEVLAANWTGKGLQRKASVNVTLKALAKDPKSGKALGEVLPARPPNLAVEPAGFEAGEGPIHIETSPPGAEVWLLIGYPNTGVSFPTIAGRAYELRALADGKLPGFASISADEWRDGGNPNEPIDLAKKKASIEKRIELQPDPDHKDPKPKKGK